jgi:hypothetical protein
MTQADVAAHAGIEVNTAGARQARDATGWIKPTLCE